MYIRFVNFNYIAGRYPQSVAEGIDLMREYGFEATLHDEEDRIIAVYYPVGDYIKFY